jgi:hypothetical protein
MACLSRPKPKGAHPFPLEARLQRKTSRLQPLEVHLQWKNSRLQSLEVRLQSLEVRLQSLEVRLQSLEVRLQSLEVRLQSWEVALLRQKFRPIWLKYSHFRNKCTKNTKNTPLKCKSDRPAAETLNHPSLDMRVEFRRAGKLSI